MAKKLSKAKQDKLKKLLKDIIKNNKEEFTDYDVTLEISMFDSEGKKGKITTDVTIINYTK